MLLMKPEINIGLLVYFGKSSGVYQYTEALINALKSQEWKGYRVVIYTFKNNQNLDSYGIEIRKYGGRISFMLKIFVRAIIINLGARKPVLFTNKERKAIDDIDILVSPLYPILYPTKPTICTIHDMLEKHYPKFIPLPIKIFRSVVKRAIALSSRIILCESKYVANDLHKYLDVPPARIKIIPLPPPIPHIGKESDSKYIEQVRLKYDLPSKFIIYPAQFWPHKNHRRLLKAMRILLDRGHNISLVLTGSKWGSYNEIQKITGKLNLYKSVKYIGYIDYKDLLVIYSLSKMLVMPTLFESISIPIYEAFTLGVPVCCSNVLAIPEQVGDAALLFDPNNEYDMASQIERLLVDERLAERLTELGRERMVNLYSRNHTEALVNVIRSCIARGI